MTAGTELNDQVIQRLFAIGLSLQCIASRVGDEEAARLAEHIAQLDETIQLLRAEIARDVVNCA